MSKPNGGLIAGAIAGALAGAAFALVPGPWDDLRRDGLRTPLSGALQDARKRVQSALAEGRRAAAERRSLLQNIQS